MPLKAEREVALWATAHNEETIFDKFTWCLKQSLKGPSHHVEHGINGQGLLGTYHDWLYNLFSIFFYFHKLWKFFSNQS